MATKVQCILRILEFRIEFFFNFQASRQELSELHLENSSLKADVMNKSHKEKGNSLFGEVQ